MLAWRLRSPRPARWGLGLLAGYLALCAGFHEVALADMKRRNPRADEVAAMPSPGLPTRWSGVARRGDRTHQRWFDVFGGQVETCAYDERLTEADLASLRATRDGRVFLWFARFPVKEIRDGRTIVFDARFRLPPGWPDRRPFAVELDAGGARFTK